MAEIYDVMEDEKENAENSDDDDGVEEKKSESAQVAIPQPSILSRCLEDMTHTEAEQEVGDALMIMYD